HKEQAVHLAQTYPHPPTSPFDVLAIAQVYAELDLREDALQLLKRYATEFGYSANFWNTYAEQLIQAKRWEELRNVATQIRAARDGVRDVLNAYSFFLEGRAELA